MALAPSPFGRDFDCCLTHEAEVAVVVGRYPYRPTCSCGERFWGYVAEHAAQIVVDAHLAEVAH